MTFNFSEKNLFQEIIAFEKSGGNLHDKVNGRTLLHLAAEFQSLEAITYLLAKGLDINSQDSYGQTPLHCATDIDIDSIVQNGGEITFQTTLFLLEHGADLSIKDYRGETPLDWVNSYGTLVMSLFKAKTTPENFNQE